MFSLTIFRSLKSQVVLIVFISLALFSCEKETNETKRKFDPKKLIQKLIADRETYNFEKKKNRIEAIVDKKIASGFNGNILIAQKDQIIFEKSNGFSNIEKQIPNGSNSRFQLASLSKTFTSVAVMQLVEKGKLSLDLTVKDYYPLFPYEGITLRSLLSHRSGLPHYEYEFDLKTRKNKLYPTNQDIMNWFETADPIPVIRNRPDHFFSYNNSNFAVLAALVEKVSGQSFAQYMHEHIFDPLEMTKTTLVTELNDSTRTSEVTYGYHGTRRIEKDFYDNVLGDKGVYSTTHDLLKWYQALKSEKVLTKESLREIYTPRSFEHPGLRNYGYGFRLWLNDKQQTDYIYHTGWWKGYNSIMFFDLREDFVIIILSNKLNRSVYQIKDIIEVLHDGKKSSTMEENILDQ
ncbi:CubicO group peptidase, beta-lactamase class C family [Spirosomataceae bacterium TFI 002]|nr:CubicO group peptidase, beta-lactamase class C family [Spirosomataceae bacterium TFI 002]